MPPDIEALPIRSMDFRLFVVQKLTQLETMMTQLLGNGQPGRIQWLEEKVRTHDRLIWMATGAGVIVGWLLQRII